MTQSLRIVSLSVIGGVTLFHLGGGRTWSEGIGVLLLAGFSWLVKRCSGNLIKNKRYAELSARRLPIAGVLAAVTYLLLQLFYGLVELKSGTPLGRVSGLAPHPNVAASTVLAFWVLLLVANESHGVSGGLNAIVIGLGSAVALLLVFAAGTRSVLLGATLAILIAFAATLWMGGKFRPRWGFALVLGSLVLTLIMAVILRPDLTSVLAAFERGPIHLTALEISNLSPWVGLGDGAWEAWAAVVEPSLPPVDATHSHNIYLYLMLGGGALGLAGVLFFLAAVICSLFAAEPGEATKLAFLVAVVALLVQGMVDVTAIYPTVYGPLIFAVAIVELRRTRTARTGSLSSARR